MARAPYVDTQNRAAYAAFVAAVREAEGQLYLWGGGHSLLPAWPDPYDCSGYVRAAWRRVGIVGHTFRSYSSKELADLCDPIAVGQQAPGDAAFYGTGGVSHVVVVLSAPMKTGGGHSYIIGANGGGPSTMANDPSAAVTIEKPGYWQSGFITYGRLREENRSYNPVVEAGIQAALSAVRTSGVPAGAIGSLLERAYGPLLARWGVA